MDGSAEVTPKVFGSPSFSIGTLTSGSLILGPFGANVLVAASFCLSSSLFFFNFLIFFPLILSHFCFCFWSILVLISCNNSSTSESSSYSSSSFCFLSKLSSSSSIGATFNPIALSALNSSVPIIIGNLIFAPLSIIIFELATDTASSSISSLFLFFLLISSKQLREISIAGFIISTFVIWISFGVVGVKLFSLEQDSDSLSSPLFKAFSMNLSLAIVFILFIAFKCSTSRDSIWLAKLSIFLQNCWNSSL